jgi:DNA-binding NtrC family response regulator
MAIPSGSGLRQIGALLRRTDVPAFWLDAGRRLVLANRAWEDLTGVGAEAMLGRVCPPDAPAPENADEPERHRRDLARALGPPPEAIAGRDVAGPVLIIRPDGERLWRRAEFWVWTHRESRPLGWLVRLRPADSSSLLASSPAQQLQADLAAVRETLRQRHRAEVLVGVGPAHARLLEQIRTAVTAGGHVLVQGETGTGKRTVARLIHRRGSEPEETGPRVLDASALSADLLERELARPLESDRPITWLVREPALLPRDLQGRLLELLAAGDRLLATAVEDPHDAMRREALLPELYYALTSLTIRLDPLRDRLDELPLLAMSMLETASAHRPSEARPVVGLEPQALEILRRYDWPGNLHELRRVIESATSRAPGDLIHADDLPAGIQGHRGAAYLPPPLPPGKTLDQILEEVERRLLERSLARGRHNKSRAADLLGISRPRLYRRMRELGIPDVAGDRETDAPATASRNDGAEEL